MRPTFFFLIAGLAWSSVTAAEEVPKPLSPAEFQTLVNQLGSTEFEAREDAQLKLAAQGESAREVLTKALKNSDPEIAQAAGLLLDKINRATVAVQVVDSAGNPLAEAPVAFNIHRRVGQSSMVARRNEVIQTGADGWACTGDLEPGAGYMVNVRCQMAGYLPAMTYQQSQELKIGRQEFKLVALRYAQVKGALIGKERVPLSGCQFNLLPTSLAAQLDGKRAQLAMRRALAAQTDAQGQFVFEQVQPGDYLAVLMADTKVLFRSEPLHVEAEETVSLGPLITEVDSRALKRDEDALTEEE